MKQFIGICAALSLLFPLSGYIAARSYEVRTTRYTVSNIKLESGLCNSVAVTTIEGKKFIYAAGWVRDMNLKVGSTFERPTEITLRPRAAWGTFWGEH